MEKLALELLRSQWLLHTDSVQQYSAMASDYLAGRTVSTGFFSSIELPDVPRNVALVVSAGALTKADVCKSAGSLTLARQIEAAAKDKSIDAIICYVETGPGGQVDGTSLLGDATAKAAKIKPVYGAFSGMACSAHMWWLSQCTKVFATSPTDQAGCIGVMATIRKSMGNADAGYEVVYSNLSPDKNAEGRDSAVMKENYLDPVAGLFHDAVKAGRGDRLKLEKENVLSGKTYIAGAAKDAGLIDGIKPFSQIVSAALADAKKQKSQPQMSHTNMRFQSVLKAAKATELSITDNGFAMNETQLQLIDEALSAQATDATALATAQSDVTRLTAELEAEKTKATNIATAAKEQADKDAARIKELEAQPAPTTEAKKPGADATVTEELTANKARYATSFDKMAVGF